MNFNSLAFLIYLPVVVGLYWLLPLKWRNIWLLAASYFFYMYWNPWFIILLLISTAIDYFCSLGMEKYRENTKIRRILLLVSVCMNLGLLFTFKYADFFGESVNSLCALVGIPYRVPQLGLILPVGISFYTFQTMSYTIDVYRGDAPAERDPITFALYVTYFPQLVAGPIENPRNLVPQLQKEHFWNWDDFSAGIRLLLCGFFRKCVVADFLGIYVNQVFGAAETANGLAVLAAGALFCFQMYCDFAGYSEIAAGAARLMGVRLMRNFDQPYLSQSYTEFFRRWHISLNQWFTSYVYIPLGGSRRGTGRKILNLIIVFTLCGLWHGAKWTYVLWGLYAAFWLCFETLTLKKTELFLKNHGIDLKNPLVVLARRCVTFLIFIPAALLFRATSLEQIGVLFSRIFTQWDISAALGSLGMDLWGLVQVGVALLAMANLGTWGEFDLPPARTAHGSARRQAAAVYFILAIALCWLALLATQDAAGFAYFQF